MGPPTFDGMRQRSASGFSAGGVLGQGNAMPLVTPNASSGLQGNGLNNSGTGNANQCELMPSVSQVVLDRPRAPLFYLRQPLAFHLFSKTFVCLTIRNHGASC